MIKKRTYTPEETLELGKELANENFGSLLCLYGELGAGKTTFVRGLAKGLCIRSQVKSPTFTIQRIYSGPQKKLYHFDCYRFRTPDALFIHEIQEVLNRNDGVVAIEWAEKIAKFLPKKRTEIHFRHFGEMTREITITSRI